MKMQLPVKDCAYLTPNSIRLINDLAFTKLEDAEKKKKSVFRKFVYLFKLKLKIYNLKLYFNFTFRNNLNKMFTKFITILIYYITCKGFLK